MPTPTPEELLEARLAELQEQNQQLRLEERAKILQLRRIAREIAEHRQSLKSKQEHIDDHETIQDGHNESISNLNDQIAAQEDILNQLKEGE